MAARRYRKKRRGGGRAFLSFLTFCIVVGAIVASVIVFLKVANVEVTGVTKYDVADIIATSEIKTGDNMFLINKFEIAERLLAEYPYIEQIKIRRRLPDTFTFEITERVPSAYIMAGDNRWLIDKNAYILEMLTPDAAPTVPKVTGAEVVTPSKGTQLILKNPDQLTVLREILSALGLNSLTANIARVDIEKLYSLNLVYGNRFLIALGDSSELLKKTEMLKAVLGELTDYDKGTINLSAVREARFRPDSDIDLSETAVAVQSEGEAEEKQTEEAQTEEAKEQSEEKPKAESEGGTEKNDE